MKDLISWSELRRIARSWQLLLLGATSVVLSIASGWTTWDGMRNFTDEPVLSFMITFGIQGVMLTVAWLIGRSVAEAAGLRLGDSESVKLTGLPGAVTRGLEIAFLVVLGAFDPQCGVAAGWALSACH